MIAHEHRAPLLRLRDLGVVVEEPGVDHPGLIDDDHRPCRQVPQRVGELAPSIRLRVVFVDEFVQRVRNVPAPSRVAEPRSLTARPRTPDAGSSPGGRRRRRASGSCPHRPGRPPSSPVAGRASIVTTAATWPSSRPARRRASTLDALMACHRRDRWPIRRSRPHDADDGSSCTGPPTAADTTGRPSDARTTSPVSTGGVQVDDAGRCHRLGTHRSIVLGDRGRIGPGRAHRDLLDQLRSDHSACSCLDRFQHDLDARTHDHRR